MGNKKLSRRKSTTRKSAPRGVKTVTSRSRTPPRKRRFVQRFFIDKFEKNGDVQWKIFTIKTREPKEIPVTTKKELVKRIKEIIG